MFKITLFNIILLFISLNSLSQSHYSDSTRLKINISKNKDSITTFIYNNTLTGMFIDNGTKAVNLNFNGDNSITKGDKFIGSNTTYSFVYTTKTTNNDILQKLNIGYDRLFISYIFNHSLSRGIKYDNLIGLGYGHKWKYLSLSYASMIGNTIYNQKPTVNAFRHSIRCKLKYEHNLFSLITEYYYQPNMLNLNDVIIYGSTKIIFLKKNKISFTVSDIINYRSINSVKLIHSISLGVSYNLKLMHNNLVN